MNHNFSKVLKMTKNSLFDANSSNIVFYNLLNIIYSLNAFYHLDSHNYFNKNDEEPAESTSSTVLSNVVQLTIILELLNLIKFFRFNSLSTFIINSTGSRLNLTKKIFRFIQLCLISILVTVLIIILCGATDLR